MGGWGYQQDAAQKGSAQVTVLSIDIETAGDMICRLGMGDGEQTLSAQWSPKMRDLLQHELIKADLVVGHNLITFDVPRLANGGIKWAGIKLADTMVAAQLLFPFQKAGLGYAAPLLIPLEPFKHEAFDKPAHYNQCDVHFTWLLWAQQTKLLVKYDLEDLYWQVEMPARQALHEASERGVYVIGRKDPVRLGYRPQVVKGGYSSITGALEARSPGLCLQPPRRLPKRKDPPHVVAPGRGYVALTFPDAVFELAAYWGDCAVEPPIDTVARYIVRRACEYAGPIVAKRELKELGINVEPRFVRATRDGWLQCHKGLTDWQERVVKTAAKEGYIVNPFGRRGYGVRDKAAVEFLFRSTISDAIKVLAGHSAGLVAIVGEALILDGANRGRFQQDVEGLPIPLTCEVSEL